MSKISKFFKKFGFTFSFKRLRKAILLIILFVIIGSGMYFLLRFNSSDAGMKLMYVKELSSKVDLEDNSVIRIYKKDVTDDQILDYVCIMGKEKRSNTDALNSTLEQYQNISFVIVNGQSNEVSKYETSKDFGVDVTLKIVEDSKNRYYLISDYNGNLDLLKVTEGKIVDVTKNTAENGLLGYTIYTTKSEDNESVLKVTLDNYNKNYLKEYKDTKELDFTEKEIDLNKYRETYLRDKLCKVELIDTDEDGTVELVTTQYILYCLEDTTKLKTVGEVVVSYDIGDTKLKYKNLEIKI